jgi:CheY-like chemotaxis protein/anti-sigma regulatory factor (Ser/Thr protein kinase)
MSRVLVVEDSRTQATQIRFQLEDASYDVELAFDGVQALASLRRAAPDIILTDLDMPNLNGLELVEAVRREFAHIPVVLMTAHGSEEIAALALSKGAASYIPKAYLSADLLPTIERLLELTNAGRQHVHAFDCLAGAEIHYVLRNDPALIAPLVGYLDDAIKLLKLCDPTGRMRIGVALQEALLNAIYHGNLDVGSEHRQQDEAVFHNLVKVRREQPPYQDRRVFLDVKASPAEIAFTIRDEGRGFDVSALPDPSAPENIENIGGRGLLLIRTFMDQVTHNDRGNAITLVKRREG